MLSEKERIESKKRAMKKYNESEKGKIARNKFFQSERGKEYTKN